MMGFIQDYKVGRAIRRSRGAEVAVEVYSDSATDQVEVGIRAGEAYWGAVGTRTEQIEFFEETLKALREL